ncbi:diguanylate cyclase [Methylomicrobium sp. Wu6]|uniref:diguanylate cyclase n=1 Tax=Methylomicrobium sp. Wu6 TaxID=3107928 RepID=UPI002DD67317|nr:diguanylate cyclase [Methylomicrobium sp. Wu6]MEC4749350.1 diguanylate cyclase [Methylomicrobium sp. Wu6]
MLINILILIFSLSFPAWAADRFVPKNAFSTLPLNASELEYLSHIDHIRMCVDPDWMPYDFVTERNEYIGINADFQKVFAERIGKEIRLIETVDWKQSLDYAKQRQCEILSSATLTEQRQAFLAFTRPFNVYPIVIATRSDQSFITDVGGVLQKTFVTVKGFAALDLLKRKYPQMIIVEANDARTGLEWVASGKVFGYLDTVATIGYQSQKHGILNIKIAGVTDVNYKMSVAVRNDYPLLLSIFDKAVASLTEADKLTILNKWISITYENRRDYRWFGYGLYGVGALLLLLALREFVVSRHKMRLQALNKELELLSNTDMLTGIANRRLLNHAFAKEIARARRYHSSFSVIMLDIDYFKTINDNFGHQAGDHVLQMLAVLLDETVRANDLVGRWGGEEFLLLCPETDLNGALQLANTIRQKIQQYDFGLPLIVTVSLGVAEYHESQSLEDLIKIADTALYNAKKAGRNQVKANGVQ